MTFNVFKRNKALAANVNLVVWRALKARTIGQIGPYGRADTGEIRPKNGTRPDRRIDQITSLDSFDGARTVRRFHHRARNPAIHIFQPVRIVLQQRNGAD